METNQTEARAYVVHLTPEEVERVRHCTFWYNPESSEWPALSYKVNTDKPLDLDALRLVLETLKKWEKTVQGTCEEVEDAIAKLSSLI